MSINATVSFGNHLTLSIFRFKIFHQTDRQTDKTDCLTFLRMHKRGKNSHFHTIYHLLVTLVGNKIIVLKVFLSQETLQIA